MERRSFLSLLVASPLLAKLEPPALLVAQPQRLFRPLARLEPVVARRAEMISLAFSAQAGFSHVVEAGRVALLVAQPQRVFRPARLLLNTVTDFELLGVSAAGEPMMDEALAAEFFDVNAYYGSRLAWHTVSPGYQYVMAVRNCGPTRRFDACLVGRAFVDLTPAELELERACQEERDHDEDYDDTGDDDDDDEEP